MKKVLLALLFLYLVPITLLAQELIVNDQFRGVVTLANGYKIFPENRLNNALYSKDNTLLIQAKEQIILNTLDYKEGLFIISKNKNSRYQMIYENTTKNFQFNFIGNIYSILIEEDKKYLLRYSNEKNKIEEILIPFRSANGFVNNQKGTLAFYRITSYIPKENDDEKDIYIFRISILKKANTDIIDLQQRISHNTKTIDLRWETANKLVVTIDSKEQKINIF